MNAILGFAQLLEYDPINKLNDQQKKNVQFIKNGGDHLLELINEVLDLSKIESGTLEVSSESLHVYEVLEEALILCKPLAEMKKITINNMTSSNTECMVMADRTRFKQVLLNLISNAIKYNRESGLITIEYNQPSSPDRVRLLVTDTGIGITEKNLTTLFEPFNRLDVDPSAVEGTGIGLTITKRLLDLMNGSISVTSAHRMGSTFQIELPKGQQVDIRKHREKFPAPTIIFNKETQNYSLLYIEDNPANLSLIEEILNQRPDIKFISAPQAILGIELARAHRPDLFLMDIHLPEMDGITAFKNLKIYDETKNIPVIAISANAMKADINRAMREGFDNYIIKPVNVEDFLDKIGAILPMADNSSTN